MAAGIINHVAENDDDRIHLNSFKEQLGSIGDLAALERHANQKDIAISEEEARKRPRRDSNLP